jgi:hypothetical protein
MYIQGSGDAGQPRGQGFEDAKAALGAGLVGQPLQGCLMHGLIGRLDG